MSQNSTIRKFINRNVERLDQRSFKAHWPQLLDRQGGQAHRGLGKGPM